MWIWIYTDSQNIPTSILTFSVSGETNPSAYLSYKNRGVSGTSKGQIVWVIESDACFDKGKYFIFIIYFKNIHFALSLTCLHTTVVMEVLVHSGFEWKVERLCQRLPAVARIVWRQASSSPENIWSRWVLGLSLLTWPPILRRNINSNWIA